MDFSKMSRSKHVDDADFAVDLQNPLPDENASRNSSVALDVTNNETAKNLPLLSNDERRKEAMPLDSAGFFSMITYSWLTRYMNLAYQQGLKREDIPLCCHKDHCEDAVQRLERMWNDEVKRHGLEGASLKRVIWKYTQTRVIVNIIVYLMSIVFGFLGPIFFMIRLLQFCQDHDSVWWHGAIWATGLAISEFMRVHLLSISGGVAYRTGTRLRSAVMTLLYKKIIRLPNLDDKSIGKMVNLIANDGQRFYEVATFVPFIIGDPFVVIVGAVHTIWLLGPHAALGMLVFVLFYPMQYFVSRLTGYFRRRTLSATDQRICHTNELLQNIKLIKMYAWEKPFSNKIKEIREDEKHFVKLMSYVQSASYALTPVVPIIAVIVTFLIHIGFGFELSPAEGFAIVTVMMSRIRPSLNTARESLKTWDEAKVIWPRIQSILSMKEVESYSEKPIDPDVALAVSNGVFVWSVTNDKDNEKNLHIRNSSSRRCCPWYQNNIEEEVLLTSKVQSNATPFLINIDIVLHKGNLFGVCGGVGSGKSSLLSVILGKMNKECGRVMIDGSLAYVPQQPWIMNATLKDNILFGEPFNVEKYTRVLSACALDEDIAILPAGDATEIGERGINLSGGQRQRVSMARAIYANRDIYLLDDPLSAVNKQVSNHIFDKGIRCALKGKTVLFVTHQLEYLDKCDEIIFMDCGRIAHHGRHVDLMSHNEEYVSFIRTFLNEDNENNLDQSSDDYGSAVDAGPKPAFLTRNRKLLNGKFSTSTDNFLMTKDEFIPITNGRLTEEEIVEKGTIPMSTYNTYIKLAGGYMFSLFVLSLFAVNGIASAMSSWWLAHWLNNGVVNASRTIGNETEYHPSIRAHPDIHYFEFIYGIFILIMIISSLLRSFFFIKASLSASNLLHSRLFSKILKSPMSFFDTTPVGQLLNLFSRDLDETDCRLPPCNEALIQNILAVAVSVIFIAIVAPWFLIAVFILAVVFVLFSRLFRCGLRDLKRLDNVSRSSIYSHVAATISGLDSIRAFGKERNFISKFMELYDENSIQFFMFTCSIRWISLRLDLIAVCVMGITAGLVVVFRGIPVAFAGLALAHASQLSGILQNAVRWASETETRFTSVQRMDNSFNRLETLGSEKFLVVKNGRSPKDLPQQGCITFSNVKMRYRPDLPLVLNNVSFVIKPKEKIGIIGRTGSGKSSLGVALFRLVDLTSGFIKIDGINICELLLEDLRSKLSIIPQYPVLFIGTIRYNMDPLQKYSDEAIWEVLERTHMKEKVILLPGQLDNTIKNGESFSVGERQLLCIARALLRHSKILVIDEATDALDAKTNILVQQTLRETFKDCTVLTITHHLNTVIHCERVLVIQDGIVIEFDEPSALLANSRVFFCQYDDCSKNLEEFSQVF